MSATKQRYYCQDGSLAVQNNGAITSERYENLFIIDLSSGDNGWLEVCRFLGPEDGLYENYTGFQNKSVIRLPMMVCGDYSMVGDLFSLVHVNAISITPEVYSEYLLEPMVLNTLQFVTASELYEMIAVENNMECLFK